jgi:hypothetical protein
MNMSRKDDLEKKINEEHTMRKTSIREDWGLVDIERCIICGLTRREPDSERDEWEEFRGSKLTLAEAARKQCE